MALQHGKTHAVYLDGLNLSALANQSSVSIDVDTAETTTFADTAKTFLEGDYGHTSSVTTFYDNTDDGWDELAFAAAVTTRDDDHYLADVVGGATAGNVCYERIVRWTSQPRTFEIGSAIMIPLSFQGTDRIGRGKVNYAGTVTATGQKTSQNYGATLSTATKYITYRVISVTGSGSVTLELEESSDNAAGDPFATVTGSSSGALTAVGVTRKTITAATEAYLRLSCTAFSGFTSVTVLVTVTTAA